MNTNVKLVPKTQAKINADIIDMLERALTEAKTGNIASFMMIYEQLDGTFRNEESGVNDVIKTIGFLEILKAEWLDDVTNDRQSK